jgi:L-lactate utilization protein LutC
MKMAAAKCFWGKMDTDYHLFLAAPSKTADIEQSLVIGAHGAEAY